MESASYRIPIKLALLAEVIGLASLVAVLATCAALPAWARGEAWPVDPSSPTRFYLDLGDSLKELGGVSSCRAWDLEGEKRRLGRHLDRFEAEMGQELRPFSVHLFAWGEGQWGDYFQKRCVFALSSHPMDRGDELQRVVVPVAAFGVDILSWRHELGHVLIGQLLADGKLGMLPSWLEEGFCELASGVQKRLSPYFYLRGFQSLYESKVTSFGGDKSDKALSAAECREILELPSVGALFYRFLLTRLRVSDATPMESLRALWLGVEKWDGRQTVSEFRRFLVSLEKKSGPPTVERAFEEWLAGGEVHAWELEFLLCHLPPWFLSPEILARVAHCVARDEVAEEGARFSLRLTLFQSWWLRRFEEDDTDDLVPASSVPGPLERLELMLRMLKQGGLAPERRQLLKSKLGWLVYLAYPSGIEGEDIFALRKELKRKLADPDLDPQALLNLICRVYPIMVPRWGLSPWARAIPTSVKDWLLTHLPNLRGEALVPPRLPVLKAANCLSRYEPSQDGWLQHLLKRHGLEIRGK